MKIVHKTEYMPHKGKSAGLFRSASVVFLMLLWVFPAGAQPAGSSAPRYNSYAIVHDDGSLGVQGRTIWLFGIHIPETFQSCRTYMRPVKCGPKAVLELDRKIGPHFVHCTEQSRNRDGSINAFCTVQGEDLSAWMLKKGWAVVLPGAPHEYVLLEEAARKNRIGIWSRLQGDIVR